MPSLWLEVKSPDFATRRMPVAPSAKSNVIDQQDSANLAALIISLVGIFTVNQLTVSRAFGDSSMIVGN